VDYCWLPQQDGALLAARAGWIRQWLGCCRRVGNAAPPRRSCSLRTTDRASNCPVDRSVMTVARDQVSGRSAVAVTMIEQAVPELVTGRRLIDRFQLVIRSKAGSALET
jgi:hypothetical protein